MAITLSEAAAKQINAQLAKRGSGMGLRVGVKPVGCSGFAYTYDIADTLRPDAPNWWWMSSAFPALTAPAWTMSPKA
jgi:Fe-S cluster assembly iron-binding protein IscA